MTEQQQKKRPRFSENAEGSGGKKPSSVLAVACSPAVTLAPTAASPVAPRSPCLSAPSPVATAKPKKFVVKSTATCQSAAKAPALVTPSPVAAKTTPALPAPSPKAAVEPEDGGSVEKSGEAMVTVAAEEETVGGLTAKKRWLHCATCSAPLKPPIFECGDRHAVCCVCGWGNKQCGACGGAATYTHSPFLDGLVGTLELPCPYSKFRCGTSVAYHAVAEHKASCGHAPCYCHECTPPFEGSPAGLVRHLTEVSGRHRWPAPQKIEYGSEQSFVLPASYQRCLLSAAEDGGMFLLALGAGGDGGGGTVTVVCVRGNARPVYKGTLTVEGPPDEDDDDDATLKVDARVPSCAVPGEVDMEDGRLNAHVSRKMLHGDGESLKVHLSIRITKFP
ncbi:unnamed protein product [Alopecurus aequalis]